MIIVRNYPDIWKTKQKIPTTDPTKIMNFLPEEIQERLMIEKTQAEQHPKFQGVLHGLRAVRSRQEQKKIEEREVGEVGRTDLNIFGDTPEEIEETVACLCRCNCCPRHQTGKPLLDFLDLTGTNSVYVSPDEARSQNFYGNTLVDNAFTFSIDEMVGHELETELEVQRGEWTDEHSERWEAEILALKKNIKDKMTEMFQQVFDEETADRMSDIYMGQFPYSIEEDDGTYSQKIQDLKNFEKSVMDFYKLSLRDFKRKISDFTYEGVLPKTKVRRHPNFCNCKCRQYVRCIGIKSQM